MLSVPVPDQIAFTDVLMRQSQSRRQLESLTLLQSGQGLDTRFEQVWLKQSLEVKLEIEEMDAKPLNWHVIDFANDSLRVQIDMTDDAFGEERLAKAMLSVTFWGTDLFKSRSTESSVRLGTKLYWPFIPT